MANLNFKWGLHDNLPEQRSIGTVYVTTDEQSMYIDVPNNKGEADRIRIQGSVLYYKSIEIFQKTEEPPYNKDVLYFFNKVKDNDNEYINALMCYDGEEWHQINVTRDEIKDIDSALTKIDGHSTDIANLQTDVQNLKNSIGSESNLAQTLQELEAAVGQISSDTQGLTSTVATMRDAIDNINNDLAEKANASDLSDKVTNAELSAFLATKADKNELDDKADNSRVDGIAGSIDSIDKNIGSLESAIAGINGDIAGITGRINKVEGDIVELESSFNTKLEERATKEEFKDFREEITTEIATEITAVNALVYQGPAFNDNNEIILPTPKFLEDDGTLSDTGKIVESGWLYVVNQYYVDEYGIIGAKNEVYAPGDFIIATGTEVQGTLVSNGVGPLTWIHINTGYDSSLLPKLRLANSDSIQIQLTDFNDKILQAITIESISNNLTITTSGKNNDILQFGLEWNSFDPPSSEQETPSEIES